MPNNQEGDSNMNRNEGQILRQNVPIPPWLAMLANVVGDNGKYFKTLGAIIVLMPLILHGVGVAQDADLLPSLSKQTYDRVLVTEGLVARHVSDSALRDSRQVNLDFAKCIQSAANESRDKVSGKVAHELCTASYLDDRERMLRSAQKIGEMAAIP